MIAIEHIHPMLVHFPIVLLTIALLINAGNVFFHHGNLAQGQCLSRIGLVALLGGVLFAILAAVFGDIALDIALDKGFDDGPLEEHEHLAAATIALFCLLAIIQIFAIWRSISLAGNRGKVFVTIMAAGFLLLVATAYHGGELVYGLGVNIADIKP